LFQRYFMVSPKCFVHATVLGRDGFASDGGSGGFNAAFGGEADIAMTLRQVVF
jgi:hypothetical protein